MVITQPWWPSVGMETTGTSKNIRPTNLPTLGLISTFSSSPFIFHQRNTSSLPAWYVGASHEPDTKDCHIIPFYNITFYNIYIWIMWKCPPYNGGHPKRISGHITTWSLYYWQDCRLYQHTHVSLMVTTTWCDQSILMENKKRENEPQ